MSNFGERLKTRRQALGWTLDRLAKEAAVSKGFLSDLENGNQKSASSEYLDRIARALNVSLDHLVSGAPQSTQSEDVNVPSSLAALAKSENLTFQQTLMMLNLRKQIVAVRTEDGTDDFDWKPFYEAVKPFLK